MRKNITNTKATTLKKTICMAAMMTAILSLTACGDKDSAKDKLQDQIKEELSDMVEDMSNSASNNNATENQTPETPAEPYSFENGVLTVSNESAMRSI